MSTAPDTADAARSAIAGVPTAHGRLISGSDLDSEARPPFMRSKDVPPDVREAILASLYDDRSGLTRKRRLDGLSDDEASRLGEIEAYIDEWELGEDDATTADVWNRLNAIAARVVGVSASIERQRR